jgi:hypothetical protein
MTTDWNTSYKVATTTSAPRPISTPSIALTTCSLVAPSRASRWQGATGSSELV